MTFITRTNQPLKVGDRIRLGGREGAIVTAPFGGTEEARIMWSGNIGGGWIELALHPSLEIEAPEISISKEAAEKLCEMVEEERREHRSCFRYEECDWNEGMKRRINSLVKE